MRRALPLTVFVVAALLAGAAAPALAHRPPAAPALPEAAGVVVPIAPLTEVLSSAAPVPAPPWAAIALLAVAALAIAWRPRRAVALALVLVVGVLAFETGVHSAHHLGKADEAARCAVAGLATQVNGDLVHTAFDAVPLDVLATGLPASGSPVAVARAIAPDAGRAPPVLSV
jgi:hypothetical protein